MDHAPFSISDSIKKGWELTKANLGFLILYQLILFLITLFLSISSNHFFLHLLLWVVVVLVKIGFFNSALLITQSIKPGFDQLYSNWRMFLSWVIANFLFGLMVVIGLALLIFPGCYLAARYGFFPFFILDKQIGPIESLKEAARASTGIRWPIFLFFLACIGLNILGLLLFGVGFLISEPVTLLAFATIYWQIKPKTVVESQ